MNTENPALDSALAVSPSALASELQMSLRQLERQVRNEYKLTVREWLTRLRVERAKRLLLHDPSAKSAAYALGYRQPSHFSRQFKRITKQSPAEFALTIQAHLPPRTGAIS